MDNLGNVETSFYAPKATPDQVKEKIEEQSKVRAGMELLEELIERLEARATFYDTLSSVKADVTTTPEEHLRQVIANDQTKANLKLEISYFTTLRDTYKKG